MQDAHILIVDDDNRLRKLLHKYLSDNGWLVTSADSADDARKKLSFFKFDIIILDVMMPNETGIEFTRWLQQKMPKEKCPPILMLTAMGEVADRIAGLESGADDYLAKPFEPMELLLRIRNILKRSKLEQKRRNQISFGKFTFDMDNDTLSSNDNSTIHLTMSEICLLKTLLKQEGKPISRDKIVASSQGTIANERSVDVQITRLRKKIEEDPSRPRYIQTVRGEGYALRP